jgi:hypothetical protein
MVEEEYKIPYKIGLISTHGTGKTALVYALTGELKKRGYNVDVISEVSTKISKQGYPINQNTNLPAQLSILLHQMIEELSPIAKRQLCDIIITDRTVTTDNLVYLDRACGPNPFVKKIAKFMMDYAKLYPYSRIYLLPLVGELEKNGVRDLDKEFQRDIYFKLVKLLKDKKIKHIELPIPQKEDFARKEWQDIIIKNTIKDLKNKK